MEKFFNASTFAKIVSFFANLLQLLTSVGDRMICKSFWHKIIHDLVTFMIDYDKFQDSFLKIYRRMCVFCPTSRTPIQFTNVWV